jgi:hypothetical protein
MQTTEYRAFILRLRDEQHRPPAELWPAAKRYLGAEVAAELLGPEPASEPRPVPAKRERAIQGRWCRPCRPKGSAPN